MHPVYGLQQLQDSAVSVFLKLRFSDLRTEVRPVVLIPCSGGRILTMEEGFLL